MSNTPKITGTMTVREVIQKYPDAVFIFEKHGLMGCGGKSGPVEPVEFFARVHNVDAEQLLSELNQLAEGKISVEEHGSTEVKGHERSLEENLYKRFLKTAMVLLLTGGATLGAIALTIIARNASMDYSGIWKAIVQAHGHVQFYGWVGLFIMGVAYQVIPRLGATTLASKSLAAASFALMLVGILMRAISQPFATNPIGAVGLIVSSALELIAVFLFWYVILKTIQSSEQKTDVFEKYILGGIVWFGIATVAGLALAIYLAVSQQNVIPDSLDAPYLHIFAIGFITMIILGISLRVLPLFMGLKSPSGAIANMSFWMLNAGIVVYSLSSLFKTQLSWLNGVYEIGVLLEVIAFAAFIINLHRKPKASVSEANIFSKPLQDVSETGAWRGYEKFIYASYFWLAVAIAMFGAFGIYEAITGQSAGHALIGSYRHALTVGFISMIIFGMGARIVPVFAGVTLYSTMLLTATFVLVNLGNVIRVGFQSISPVLGDVSFVMMGISGWLEVTGMALFCVNLWMTLRIPQEAEAEIEGEVVIARTTKVGDILKKYPQTLEVFLEHGFTPLKNPLMRRTIAKRTTLEKACGMFSLDCDALISELKQARGQEGKARW